MASKKELEATIVDLKATVTELNETIDGSNSLLEGEKAKVVELEEKLEAANEQIEKLGNASSDKPAKVKAEKTKKLYWLHPVDADLNPPTAYGILLVANEGYYTGDMPESRAKVELGRKGKAFVAKPPKT